MPYRGQWAIIPAGQGGIVSDENPTRVLPSELVPASPTVGSAAIQTQGIVQQDGVWRREGGATSLDAAGLEDLGYKATLSSAVAWGLVLQGVQLSTGSSAATTHGATNNDSLGAKTTHVHTMASAHATVGSLLAVACTFYVVAGDTATVSVTDTRSNTWTVVGSSHSSLATTRVTLAVTIVTTQLSIGDTVTFTRSASAVSPSTAVAVSFTNASSAASSMTQAGISAIVLGSLPPTSTYPLLALAAIGNVGSSPITLTQNTGYTEALRETGGVAVDTALCYRVYTGSAVTVFALHHWRPTTTSSDWAIVTAGSNGKLYKSDSTGANLDANTLVTGLSTSARPGRFIDAGAESAGADRHLVYMNGYNAPQVLDAATTTMNALATPPADWASTNQPVNGMIHRNRLLGFGNLNDPHRIYFSTTSNHEDFTGTGSLSVQLYPSVGDRLYGCAGYLGLAWFFKYPRGIFWIDDSDSDSALWTAQVLSDAIGCAPSPYAVLPLGNDVMFLTADGRFMLLSTVKEAGGVAHARALSTQLRLDKWLRDTLTLSKLSQCVSVWYPHKRQALWGLPANGSTSNTLLLTFDFEPTERDGMPVVTPSYRDTADALALFRESDQVERPMLGEGCYVYLLDRTSRAKDGGGSTSFYCTQHFDLRHADPANAARMKQFDQLIIRQNTNPSGSANTYTIYVFIDRALRATLSGSTATRRQRHMIRGAGHEIALGIAQSEPTADFAIIEHLIGYVPTDEGAI